MLSAVVDITIRKQHENQLEVYASQLERVNRDLARTNHDLEAFAYVAAHDLKEPLRGMNNYAIFLIEDYAAKLDEAGKSKLHTIQRLAEQGRKLIDSLLEYSQVGRMDMAAQETDLNDVVAEVLQSLQISLHECCAEVHVLRPLPVVTCDRARVGEVFSNLITNAIKYNDELQKWIEIGFHADCGRPVFYVRDNGIGIAEKHFDTVFTIFKRLHARDKYGGGTGVGLAIAKRIVERHGGRIWIESASGHGSTFCFTLQGEPDVHGGG